MEGPDIVPAHSVQGATPAIHPKIILLVEDDRDLREMAEAFLTSRGYRVLTAETGGEATEVWSRHKDEIALLFTDIIMPDGPSGIEIGARFHHEKPGLKILYTSGYRLETIPGVSTIRQTGAFVPKPYIPSRLILLIRDLLNEEKPKLDSSGKS